MPPHKVKYKGIPPGWKPRQDNVTTDPNTIGDIVKLIYDKQSLRAEIDYALEHNHKIKAIKLLKEELDTYHMSRKYNLRTTKDSIDLYQKKFDIKEKIKMLRERIEWWCEQNGYGKLGSQKEVKSKDGHYTYRYSDWEMIDDHEGLMINDSQWNPSAKQLKLYNKLWKKYEK